MGYHQFGVLGVIDLFKFNEVSAPIKRSATKLIENRIIETRERYR